MAWYKYNVFLHQVDKPAYDALHSPGVKAPFAGIYRCHGCGHEVGIALGHTLPPQGHHQHTAAQGPIQWRLIVYADHNP